MEKLLALIALVVPFAFIPASAQTAQQNKMASCNKEAAGKKGDERKAFMKECLSAKPAASTAQKVQQDKMKSCNADAKSMKGDERKAFMKKCLSKSSNASTDQKTQQDKTKPAMQTPKP